MTITVYVIADLNGATAGAELDSYREAEKARGPYEAIVERTYWADDETLVYAPVACLGCGVGDGNKGGRIWPPKLCGKCRGKGERSA